MVVVELVGGGSSGEGMEIPCLTLDVGCVVVSQICGAKKSIL